MHIPVLLKEVIDGLEFRPGDILLDCTVGEGGHSAAVCEAYGPAVKVVAIDADESSANHAREKLATCGAVVIRENFRNLDRVLDQLGLASVNKIIFDLGWSSVQMDGSGRGFSFQKDEPLLMNLDNPIPEGAITASQMVNSWSEKDLADAFYNFGGERRSRRIAKAIVEARRKKRIETSKELAEIIEGAIPRIGKIHPATKTFQAIRIAVNDELGVLEEGLRKGFSRLADGGRVAVISFHSLEDGIVKKFFLAKAGEGEGKILTKKPITPSRAEQEENRRSRSAKLRIMEKSIGSRILS